jgi:hypothetical protein
MRGILITGLGSRLVRDYAKKARSAKYDQQAILNNHRVSQVAVSSGRAPRQPHVSRERFED